jgi:Flp pilus assembly protein TadG
MPLSLSRFAHRGRRGSSGQSVAEFALVLPIMLILLLAIVDFARIYTTAMSVESAAREAADFGTSYGAEKWDAINSPITLAEMQTRACVAASNLPDYEGDDPAGTTVTCTNPSFDYCVTPSVGGTCGALNPADVCEDPNRATPCAITVTLGYDFHLIAPFNIDVFGTNVGVPNSVNFDRDSTFAITDIELAPGT